MLVLLLVDAEVAFVAGFEVGAADFTATGVLAASTGAADVGAGVGIGDVEAGAA